MATSRSGESSDHCCHLHCRLPNGDVVVHKGMPLLRRAEDVEDGERAMEPELLHR